MNGPLETMIVSLHLGSTVSTVKVPCILIMSTVTLTRKGQYKKHVTQQHLHDAHSTAPGNGKKQTLPT